MLPSFEGIHTVPYDNNVTFEGILDFWISYYEGILDFNQVAWAHPNDDNL